ncbi:MAG: hypothetical protein U1F43_21530 [Myxococcota bacterium]
MHMAHRRRPRSIVSAALAASALTTCGAGLALALALAGSGCEPAPEDATVTPSAPVLSTFTVAPDQLTVGVAVQLQGSVDVVDADGDLTELVFRMIPPSGTPSADLPMPVAAAGQTSGHVPFALDFTADAVGPHTLELRAKDAAGHVSDAVSASLTVSAVVAPTPHAPELSSVSFQPHDATVGSPVTLAGTVHVSDADGDATKVHLRVRAPGGVLSPETVVDATFDGQAGDVAFSLAYRRPSTATTRWKPGPRTPRASCHRSGTASSTRRRRCPTRPRWPTSRSRRASSRRASRPRSTAASASATPTPTRRRWS